MNLFMENMRNVSLFCYVLMELLLMSSRQDKTEANVVTMPGNVSYSDCVLILTEIGPSSALTYVSLCVTSFDCKHAVRNLCT